MSRQLYRQSLLPAFLVGVATLPCFGLGQTAEEEKPASPPIPAGLRVFSAAHSLNWYVPGILTELVSAYGIKDHKQVGLQRIGMSRVIQHWEQNGGSNPARQALEKSDVDVFTMSPIQFPDEGIDNFVKLGLEHNPKMRFTVQISWGGYEVDNQRFSIMDAMSAKPDREKTPNQLKMLNLDNIKAAEEQAEKINKQVGRTVVFLVPTSAAHIALRTMIYNKEIPGLSKQAELFADNIGHPTAPVQALNAYLHFAVIYGRSPVGLPIPNVLKNARRPEWNDEKFNRTLQELAWKTVVNYSPSGVKTTTENNAGVKGKYYKPTGMAHKWFTCRLRLYRFAPLLFYE
ncbi:MAG: hypothetical protein ABSG67_09600 [Thermoguttaceae bacterium]|jgi:hypothetical protein